MEAPPHSSMDPIANDSIVDTEVLVGEVLWYNVAEDRDLWENTQPTLDS